MIILQFKILLAFQYLIWSNIQVSRDPDSIGAATEYNGASPGGDAV